MKLKWQDNYVFYLIEKVHTADYIWNHTLPSYKMKYKKQQFWLDLVDDMNSIFTPNIPFQYDEVTHKWFNIKSYFSAEKQRMDKARRSGASAEQNIESSWKFFQTLQFLRITSEQTPSVNNFNKKSLENLEQHDEEKVTVQNSDPDLDVELPFSLIDDSENSILITPHVATTTRSSKTSEPMAKDTTPITVTSDIIITPAPGTSNTQTFGQFDESSSITNKLSHVGRKRKINNRSTAELNSNASALIEASQNLTNAFCAAKIKKNDEIGNTFGNYIGEEILKLDPDLQLQAKRQMHNILMDLQSEQLMRNDLM